MASGFIPVTVWSERPDSLEAPGGSAEGHPPPQVPYAGKQLCSLPI